MFLFLQYLYIYYMFYDHLFNIYIYVFICAHVMYTLVNGCCNKKTCWSRTSEKLWFGGFDRLDHTTTGWWFGTWFIFSIYWEFHHPKWRTHIFQRGRLNHQPVSLMLTPLKLEDLTKNLVILPKFFRKPTTVGFCFCGVSPLMICG